MGIKLQRLNVVKIVESEEKAQALERQGFARVEDKKPVKSQKQKKDSDKDPVKEPTHDSEPDPKQALSVDDPGGGE